MPVARSPKQPVARRQKRTRSHPAATDACEAAPSSIAGRHGVCATRLQLDSLSAQHLAAHLEPMLADWLPANDYEQRLVHDLAVSSLKLARVDTLELRALDAAINGAAVRYPALASLAGYRNVVRREQGETIRRLSAVQEDRRAAAAAAELAEAEARVAAVRSWVNKPERRGAPADRSRYH